MDDAVDVFRKIYKRDHWKGGSGEGSAADATAHYRRVLEAILSSRPIQSVVDVGCGDWQFSCLVDWSNVRYTGIDIVPELISAVALEFGSASIRFVPADARTACLPKADLLICKDVLQHWPNQSIIDFLRRNLRRFGCALLTNDIWSVREHPGVNADVPLGHWRPIDLEAPPFSLRVRERYDFNIRDEWIKRALVVTRGGFIRGDPDTSPEIDVR